MRIFAQWERHSNILILIGLHEKSRGGGQKSVAVPENIDDVQKLIMLDRIYNAAILLEL